MKRRWLILASVLSLILLPVFPGEANAAPGATPLLLSISSPSKREGNSGTTTITFKVTLSTRSASAVTVDYRTYDSSAISVANLADPADFVATSGRLTFAPGDRSQTITVQIIGDTRIEVSETFVVLLSNPTGGATIAGSGQGFGTITNDDH